MRKQYPTFGKYQIVNELGRGGMGVVYKAYDTKLKSYVALKMIINREQEHIERFFSETAAIAQLNHPNIVRFYEHGEKPYPYFTMEYIEGCTLADLIKHKKITPQQLIDILIPICDALYYSHCNEIMHRDIKPSNIMITNNNVPKIMDFGLAKKEDKTQISKSGQMLGTITYMAPEQVEGGATYHSDIYSLGATMYEALTFRTVFQGAIDINIILQIMNDPPLNLRQLNPDISPYLEAICLKCLQKNQRKRYENFKQLSKEFNNYKAHRPIIARPYSSKDILTNFFRKYKAICYSLIVIFCVLAISLVITLQVLSFAEQEKHKTKAALNKTMNVIEYSLNKYEKLKKDKHFARLCSDIFEDLEAYGDNQNWSFVRAFIADTNGETQKSLEYYNKQIKLHPTNYLAYSNRGILYKTMNQYKKALTDFNKAIALKSNFFGAYSNRAFLYQKINNYSKALLDFNKAIAIKPNSFEAYFNRGSLYRDMKQNQKAIADFDKTITINSKYFDAYLNRGNLHTQIKNYQQALQDFNKAIDINPKSFKVYNSRGNLYNEMKQYQKAISDFSKTININPRYFLAYNNRGSLHLEMKNYSQALIDYNKAVSINPGHLEIRHNRGLLYLKMEKYQKALQDFNKAIAINPNYSPLYLRRGAAYFSMKQYTNTIKDFKRVLTIYPYQAHQGLYLSYKNLQNTTKARYHFSQMKKHKSTK